MILVIEVMNKEATADFIELPKKIYKDNDYYVPDLDSDIRALIDGRMHKRLNGNDVQAFVAYDDQQQCVGRIVGIINHRANKRWNTHNVRFGLIEFIDDIEVVRLLLEAVEHWGREHGMTHIQGPLGITDFDKEGMLVEGFEEMGSIITIYNPPYYPKYMEELGFEKEVDWVQMHLKIPEQIPAKYARVASYLKESTGLHVRKLTNHQILKEGYGLKVFQLFNEAYHDIFGFVALEENQIINYLNHYVRLVDKQLIPVVEDEKGDIVGACVSMGRLSQASRRANGHLWPFGWWHFLRSLYWKREDTAEMLLIGIRPDYQGLGVNALFFADQIPIFNKYGFRYAETGPQLEDNVRELTQWKPLEPKVTKRRSCYKKVIEP